MIVSIVVAIEVNLRLTVSRPACPCVRRPSGTRDQFFFLFEISFRQLRLCYFVVPSLTRGRLCNLLYDCFWFLPEQPLLGRSPAELMAKFYCLIWDVPSSSPLTTLRDYGGGILTRLHTGKYRLQHCSRKYWLLIIVRSSSFTCGIKCIQFQCISF
jgi:hypothetical protein